MDLKERNEISDEFKWKLGTLFDSDEAFEKSLRDLDEEVKGVVSYRGKLNNVDDIHDFLVKKYDLLRKVNNVFTYASLRRTEDTRKSDAQSMYSRSYSKYVSITTALAFSEPELLSLDEDTFNKFVGDEKLSEYKFYLMDLYRAKNHTLLSNEEEIIASFGEVLANPGEVADALMDADMVFDSVLDKDGVEHELNSSNFILLQTSNDRVLRENAFKSFYKSYKQHINTFASTYSGAVKGSVVESKLRKYNSSLEMSLSSDNIPLSVYNNLIDTVHSRMDLMYRYVRLRKRLLKLDELHYYDLYAPLVSGDSKQYSYDEAKEMVVDAVKPLGEAYVERVKDAYKDGWIDVYPNKGKGSGAFSSGTYDSYPYIMMNYTGTLDSVSTLAHEMGHSQHSYLTNHTQPIQYADYSLFVAEVASTVNENLLIEQLLSKESDTKNRLALLNQYLEGFKGTVYRQTMFAEFEKEAHALLESGASLDPTTLNDLYEKLIKLYFGEDLIVDEEVKYEWARIPHFYYIFYVFVYATGYASAVALSEGILKKGEEARKKYLEFLSMGSSQYPLDELRHGGVDLTTPEPINLALDKFERVLEEAEKCANQLGL